MKLKESIFSQNTVSPSKIYLSDKPQLMLSVNGSFLQLVVPFFCSFPRLLVIYETRLVPGVLVNWKGVEKLKKKALLKQDLVCSYSRSRLAEEVCQL